MDRFHIKLVSFLLSVTNTLAWTNTLAYYRIHKLQIGNLFIVQSPGLIITSKALSYPNETHGKAVTLITNNGVG